MSQDDHDNDGDDGEGKPYRPIGGEDEGSTEHDGSDEHLHDDQKPLPASGAIDKDDRHKAEKLTKAGRDIDPDEGSD